MLHDWKIRPDATGKVIDINFVSGNYEADELVAKNTATGDRNSLFDTAYILGLIDNLREKKKNIKFTHYFEKPTLTMISDLPDIER